MKKTLSLTILLTCGLAWAGAQDAATTLQVAPSDQVVYPDASQILNKTDPVVPKAAPKPATKAPVSSLPTTKPLAASPPIRAEAASGPLPPAPTSVPASDHGWFLKWTIPGDEATARAWAQALGRTVKVVPAGEGQWAVLQGPLTAGGLKEALGGQAGVASLVKL